MIKVKIVNKEEIFERISNGLPYGKDLKPYNKTQLQLTLSHFLEKEEYEKCQIISDFISQRFKF